MLRNHPGFDFPNEVCAVFASLPAASKADQQVADYQGHECLIGSIFVWPKETAGIIRQRSERIHAVQRIWAHFPGPDVIPGKSRCIASRFNPESPPPASEINPLINYLSVPLVIQKIVFDKTAFQTTDTEDHSDQQRSLQDRIRNI